MNNNISNYVSIGNNLINSINKILTNLINKPMSEDLLNWVLLDIECLSSILDKIEDINKNKSI